MVQQFFWSVVLFSAHFKGSDNELCTDYLKAARGIISERNDMAAVKQILLVGGKEIDSCWSSI